ncbi:MAG: fumarate hydratase [Clostridia bacterium]|nr:fumarate hydratase [Clostridia bacterium]
MREIDVSLVRDTLEKLFVEANLFLPCDVEKSIRSAKESEISPAGRNILDSLLENLDAAKELNVPICQDTGMAVVFMEIGQDVHFTGGDLTEAVNEGVRRAYVGGYLRKSVVSDPLERVNTDDNTPAVVHYSIVPGENVRITAAPKGFGSENMSKLKMFTPAAGEDDIVNFVTECVVSAGSNPCPPVVVGVGIGGTFELCARLAKEALQIPLDEENENPRYAALESRILQSINKTGVGPQGIGGKNTALGVKIKTYATHIAGLPVAVNISCHVTRHKTAVL